MPKQDETLRANATSSGARWGIGSAVGLLIILGGMYLYASNDPNRTTVAPTVERAPSATGIGPGRPVTPDEATRKGD